MISFAILVLIEVAAGGFVVRPHTQATPEIGFSNIEACEYFAKNFQIEQDPLFDPNPVDSYNYIGVCTERDEGGYVEKTLVIPLK